MSEAQQVALLPRPTSVVTGDGSFTLSPELTINGPADWAAIVRRLITRGTGLELPIADDGRLRLVKDD